MVKTMIDLRNRKIKDYDELIKKLTFLRSVLDADHLLREGQSAVGYRLAYCEHNETTEKYVASKMADVIIDFIDNEPEEEGDE